MKLSKKNISYTAIILLGALALYLIFANTMISGENKDLRADLLKTQNEYASTTATLTELIGALEFDLGETLGENAEKDAQLEDTISVLQDVRGNLEETQEDLRLEEAKIGILTEQVSSITDVVSQMDKLSKTDEELLQKYSKVYFLNEHYIPENLVLIEEEYEYNTEKRYWFHRDAYGHLKKMMDAALADGIDISVISSYRSFYAQAALKEVYTVTYGEGANAFSADQGYSEHQLGTTLDFTDSEIGLAFEGFEGTLAYAWLLGNGYKYGFIQSYPPDNKFYVFEPWHWRFVGVALAEKLRSEGKYFYDEEQRELSNYLISIFDPIEE